MERQEQFDARRIAEYLEEIGEGEEEPLRRCVRTQGGEERFMMMGLRTERRFRFHVCLRYVALFFEQLSNRSTVYGSIICSRSVVVKRKNKKSLLFSGGMIR